MQNRPRPFIAETLESRKLMSSAHVLNGVLTIRGDAGLANTINVDLSPDGTSVDVSVSSVNHRGITNTLTKEFPRTLTINSVQIFGSSKIDTIRLGKDSHGNIFDIATKIDAGAGNDIIGSDAAQATIFGGSGNDTIDSTRGTDIIHGDAGNDIITSEGGATKIDGGAGNDIITVANGNDTIRGGSGKDSITAGSGNDLIFGESDNDTIVAGDGTDTLWGGAGNDNIHAGNGNDTLGGVLGKNTLIGGSGHDTFVVRNNALTGQTTNYSADNDTLVTVPKENNPPKF